MDVVRKKSIECTITLNEEEAFILFAIMAETSSNGVNDCIRGNGRLRPIAESLCAAQDEKDVAFNLYQGLETALNLV